jgi:hypothetical protein
MNILQVDQLVNSDTNKENIQHTDQNLPPSPTLWTPNGSTHVGKKRTKKGFFSGAKKRGFGFQNLSLLGKRQFKEPNSKPIKYNDLTQAIMNGEVKWEELSFKPEHVKYIRNNKKLLIDSMINN